MAQYQQHGQPITRVDEYGNPIPGGHGIQGQAGGADTGSYGQHQAGYGPTGTGTHDVGGYGGSGQPAYGATGTGIHDAGGPGGYGATGTGPHHGGMHGGLAGIHDGGRHTGTHGVTGTGGHGTGYGGATGVTGVHDSGVLGGGGHTGGATGLGTHGTGHGATGVTGVAFPHAAERKTDGILRRSGSSSSSSSSSSEDDGMGGRRKKGLKQKIKEKMPGGHKDNQAQATATGPYGGATGTTGGTYAPTATGAAAHEKKGVVEKIKEKLPGGHKDSYEQQHTTATGGYAPGRTGTTDTYGTTTAAGTHEKKGFMEKIKEKLPGQH
nr:unnamed protein product [Digitaria exilis]